MSGISEWTIIFLLTYLMVPVLGVENVTEAFIKYRVVPDIIPVAPSALVKVVYPGDVEVLLGNEFNPIQTLIKPAVDWEDDSNSFYTFAMFGDSPLPGQFLHWLVGNIPGNDISRGQTLAVYFPPIPLAVTGLYRYVFLVYKQPNRIEFNTTLLNFTATQLRVLFFMNDFAERNELGNPQFGNLLRSRFLPLSFLPTVESNFCGTENST